MEIVSTFLQSNVEDGARLTSNSPSFCDEAQQHGRLRRPFWMLGIFKIRNGLQRVMFFVEIAEIWRVYEGKVSAADGTVHRSRWGIEKVDVWGWEEVWFVELLLEYSYAGAAFLQY